MIKKVCRQCLSLVLSLLIGLSALTGVTLKASAAEATGGPKVTDLVLLAIDKETDNQMSLYAGGIYESCVKLSAGKHTYTVKVNGSAKAADVSVNVPAEENVYIRYYSRGSSDAAAKNNTVDSINNAVHFKTSATLTGALGSIGTELNISDWVPNDTDGDLDYLGGGRYSKTFKFSATKSDVNISYKVAYNHAWGYGECGSNVETKVPAGSTSFTIFADYLQGICTDSIREPAINIDQKDAEGSNLSKPAFTTTVSLIGTVRGSSGTWDPSAAGWDFSQITKNLYVFSKTFDKGTYEYKVVFDKKYKYDKIAENISFKVDSDDTNVVFLYDASSQKLFDTVNKFNAVSEALGYQFASAKVIDNANGMVEFVFQEAPTDKISLTYAPKSSPEKAKTISLSAEKDASGTFTSGNLFLGDGALDYIYFYTVNGTRTLDPSAENTYTYNNENYSNYTRAAFTGRAVYVPGTLPGKSWDPASNKMTYKGKGLYSYTFKDVPPANNYQYKITVDGTWNENYGMHGKSGGDNLSLDVNNQQDVTVYYNDITHLSVTSLNYLFVDPSLSGTGVPSGTKLTDDGLTGIYQVTVSLPAGTYSDFKINWKNKSGRAASCNVAPFTLAGEKNVTFSFDPLTELCYSNASDRKIDGKNVYYNTQDRKYKSTYGAVEQNKRTTFSIQTGDDVSEAYLFIKGPENKRITMTKSSAADGKIMWSTTQSFATIGQYTYYFELANAYGDFKVYGDDDGYYGTGKLTDPGSISPYDLVVYKEGYKTPDWMKNAVIYQIFPDRFYNGDTANDDAAPKGARGATNYEFVKDWSKYPENPEQESQHAGEYPSQAYKGDGIWGNEIYGGDIKGITQKIDYLKKLGVNVIYVNPIFSSVSNHRYDTTDYKKIDPILGTEGDFTELCQTAKRNGMHVILDGVYNHVSDDSIYFDRYYKYVGVNGKVGAYPYWAYVYDYIDDHPGTAQDAAETAATAYFKDHHSVRDFTYTKWFTVTRDPLLDQTTKQPIRDTIGGRNGKKVYGYEGWWGYDSMPVIKATNGSEYQTSSWAKELVDGPDSVTKYWIRKGSDGWRLDCANEVSDETWQKFRSSVKALGSDNVIIGEIWADATKYLLGDMYDSCMNYQFRNAILTYTRGGSSADCAKNLEKLRERYPSEAFYAMMNLLDSHDTTRLLSYLDGIDDDRNQKDIAHTFPTYAQTSDAAKKKQYMAALLQLTYPGAPTIYYGDEVGVVGADDPDDRRTMDWSGSNQDLFQWYAKLISIRNSNSALRTGSISMLKTDKNEVMAYVRADSKNQFLIAANNSGQDVTVTLDASTVKGDTLVDMMTNTAVPKKNGAVTMTIPAYSGVLLAANASSPTDHTQTGDATDDSDGNAYISDTTDDFDVNGAYTFKITSKNGKAPDFAVGTPSVFRTTLVKRSGNDYFYKITAIGAPGAQSDINLNGGRLLVATVGKNPKDSNYSLSDTRCNLVVDGAYTFKITNTYGKVPDFAVGAPSVFRTTLVKHNGNDYYYKITAIGAPGAQSGIYLNGSRLLVATVGKNPNYSLSDTRCNLVVDGAYTFKITNTYGKVPDFAVGTPNVFQTTLVKHNGNDYYYKITAIGAPGAQSGIYLNGSRLLVATIKKSTR